MTTRPENTDSAPERDWLFDGHGEPRPEDRPAVDALRSAPWQGDARDLMARLDADPAPRRLHLPRRWRVGALAAAAVALGATLWLLIGRDQPSDWRFASGGHWRVGQWVQAAPDGEIRATSSIGRVTLEQGSRARLVAASRDEHRIELAQGSMEAFILAPPRLFFVDTPSATAVDMGCAYRIEVDADGAGMLHVTAGWVELQAEPVASRVPSGASCRIEANRQLGLPVFDDAPEAFRAAVERIESGDFTDLNDALAAARRRDSLTLWHLLARTATPDRERVVDRLAELAPPPRAAPREQVLALDQAALDAWWSVVRRAW